MPSLAPNPSDATNCGSVIRALVYGFWTTIGARATPPRGLRGRAGAGWVFLLLTLVGCSAASPPSGTPPSSARSETVLDSSSVLTVAQALELRARDLAALARDMRLTDVTDPGLVRWTYPGDSPDPFAGCMSEAGFPANNEGLVELPTSQRDALYRAEYVCRAKYSVYPYYTLPLSPEAAGRVYDWALTHVYPCVLALGYQISEPPSREVFSTQLASEAEGLWDPVMEAQMLTSTRVEQRQLDACSTNAPLDQVVEHPDTRAP